MKSESSLSANKQLVLIGAGLLAMAAASPALADTANDTYTWSAELVADDWLTLPVVFVSTELDGRYIRFSVPVPSDDLAKVASLSPGQWITATSPRRATRNEEAVADMRPYNDVG